MAAVSLSHVRTKIGKIVGRAAYGNERIVIENHGQDIAAVISIQDLRLFEELEDRLLSMEASRRLSDPKEKPVPYHGPRRK